MCSRLHVKKNAKIFLLLLMVFAPFVIFSEPPDDRDLIAQETRPGNCGDPGGTCIKKDISSNI